MQIGIIQNHKANQDQIKKVQLKFGNQLKLMRIKNGQKNTTIQIQKKRVLEQK